MIVHLMESKGFNIFGLHITFYGLMMAIAFIVAIILAVYLAKKKGLKSEDIITMALYVIPLSILGARTYFCIFSDHHYTFLEFFEIWNGGLAILGGVIGGLIAIILYSLIHKKNLLTILDVVAPCLILGQCIGRIGCYFGGCCYGYEVTNSALWFFPVSIQIDGVWHYATMFWECFWCLCGFIALFFISRKAKEKGTVLCSYLCIYGVGRALIETMRGDSLFIFGTIKVSQALSIFMIVLGIIGFILIYTNKRKRNEKVNHS